MTRPSESVLHRLIIPFSFFVSLYQQNTSPPATSSSYPPSLTHSQYLLQLCTSHDILFSNVLFSPISPIIKFAPDSCKISKSIQTGTPSNPTPARRTTPFCYMKTNFLSPTHFVVYKSSNSSILFFSTPSPPSPSSNSYPPPFQLINF